MLLNQVQVWARTASTLDRADAANALARAFLYSELDEAQRRDALMVLTGFLDDPSPAVRRGMAEAFASALEAPHHIVLALAEDQPSIAGLVLSRSPVLTDAELIDFAATGEVAAQVAIAARLDLSAPVAAAVAEVARTEALRTLAANHAVRIPTFSLRRMIERHGDDADLREALLTRADLPVSVRIDLVAATSRALALFVTDQNWLSSERMQRVAHEEKDKASLEIARERGGRELITHLRAAGQLSIGFLFRAILSGRIDLFEDALSELSGLPGERTEGIAKRFDSAAFAAIYRRAELPPALLPGFRVVLACVTDEADRRDGSLAHEVIARALKTCEAVNDGDLDGLLVLLRRFEAEAARAEARRYIDTRAPLTLSEAESVDRTPLMLSDLDAEPPELPALAVITPARRREPVMYAVDLDALEAELLAA